MLSGLEKLKTRRAWLVPDFMVWGLPGLGDIEFLVIENIGSIRSIHFGATDVADAVQEVSFSELTDHRGNNLPEEIKVPLVMPRSKTGDAVFVVGQEAGNKFKIAKAVEADGPVAVDLLIMEMGH